MGHKCASGARVRATVSIVAALALVLSLVGIAPFGAVDKKADAATVQDVSDGATVTLEVGEELTLEASDLSGTGESYNAYSWTVSPSGIVSVSNATSSTPTLSALAEGSATLSLEHKYGKKEKNASTESRSYTLAVSDSAGGVSR